MNYRHIYHAGNFADVIKHSLLIAIIEKIKQKPAAFGVLDSFAGIGLYNLESEQAQKTQEFNLGINLLAKYQGTMPELIGRYFSLIQKINLGKQIIYYPGSPIIIASLLRDFDRLIATELHKEDIEALKKNLKPFKQANVLYLDAYQGLKALLPFKEKRGLIFLDPPFEVINEFDKLLNGVSLIYKSFSQAVTLIWYPVKDLRKLENFYSSLLQIYPREILNIEFQINSSITNLSRIGLIVINPPDIKMEFAYVLNWLKEKVYLNQACYKIDYLK